MDAPFDRGEVDRASLDATERLRARLSSRPAVPAPTRSRSLLPWVIAGGLFIFSAGMIANPWFESSVRDRLPFARTVMTSPPPLDAALAERLAALEARNAARAPALPVAAERLAQTEARVATSSDQLAREGDRIDRLTGEVARLTALLESDRARSEAATAAATAAAARAEAMLALVLARQAIEAGRPLGAIEAPLRKGFEARYPAAVGAVTALGTAPATLASLRRDFDALRPVIGAPPRTRVRVNWWQTLTGRVTAMVAGGPAARAASLSEAAATALARGDATAAAAAVRRLGPPRTAAISAWLAAVDRRAAGLSALTTLEAAAAVPSPLAAV